ncbi:MAG TPA: CopG family antitoxin [Thermomicrobiales bacterium]|nr:CopG family antitoxin [Thermomicrobiales bacterium]
MKSRPNKNYSEAELGYPTEAVGRIPSFANRDEEAEFWDTHDLTEFDGVELHPIEVTVGGELAERLTIRLEQDDRSELNRRARAIGVGPSTLVRMWVKERLNQGANGE